MAATVISDAERVQANDLGRAKNLVPNSEPLVKNMYTADPSAHAFQDKIYIYPSHDIESDQPTDDEGSHFAMEDYHVFSLDNADGKVVDHGVALHVNDVPWAEKQMWAPDAAEKDGKYYLYFPARDHQGIFRIGVAVADNPAGPFEAEPEAIKGSYSIDPAVFQDIDNQYYIYFGGLWGGQLQKWRDNKYLGEDTYPEKGEPALGPLVAKLSPDMLNLDEEVKEIVILDENGDDITVEDTDRRYFEGPWVHKFKNKYYLSYSTGDTHKIVYATSDNPYGPFTYQGVILNPVLGWTTHHSIVEFQGQWYLFYHDSTLSGGVTHLRSVKMAPLQHNDDGSIVTIEPYQNTKED
ncbi:MAG: glycoside hydrolase family 43 protein [Colwellia sp.]